MSDKNITVSPTGKLTFKKIEYKCALGKNGVTEDKKEGDQATPTGCLPIREIYYRRDRLPSLSLPMETIAITPDVGWCDDMTSPNYNRFENNTRIGSDEKFWREDNIYDIIVVLGYNDNPPVPGKGSAIFMHVAREDYSPTAGCIALALPDLLEILRQVDEVTLVCVEG